MVVTVHSQTRMVSTSFSSEAAPTIAEQNENLIAWSPVHAKPQGFHFVIPCHFSTCT